MKTLDTFLFDLDGTLIDTNEIIIRSYTHAYKTHLPSRVPSREEIIRHIGPTLREIFLTHTDDVCLVDQLIETYRAYYTEHELAHHRLYPGVIETLKHLKLKGYQLGIVTTKFKEAALPSIRHYGIDKLIDIIIALDDVTHPKPHKEPIIKALHAFKSVSGALMIGDNVSDILAAQNAGILSAGVAWSIKGPDHLKQANPDYMLETMADCISIAETINKEV